jgi:polar amino acid transport system ATP-binding protein
VITFENVSKWFDRFQALDDISGTIGRGQMIVLCGPSGSGKSTLVRTVNRLEPADRGRVLVDGVDAGAGGVDINKFRMKIGFVAQQYNLFPHLTALENVAIGLRRLRGMARGEAEKLALDHLGRVGLNARAAYYPADLSGGEKQRVAIVRALAMEPSVMLLDEPTSSLDPELVGEVLSLLKSLMRKDLTMMCVTHEMGFAREVADQVWFMAGGKLLEVASPADFFAAPRHPRAQDFVSKLSSQPVRRKAVR